MKIKTALPVLTLFCTAGLSYGQVTLLTDDFSYADGDLAGNGNWVSHSGTAGTLDVVSGAAVVTQNSGSEDAHTVFEERSTGVLTAAFDISISAPAAMTGTDFEYAVHFMQDSTFTFRGRMDIQAPTDTGDYTLGISTLSSTAESALSVDFDFGDVVPVILTFDLDAGTASLTAGAETISSAVTSLGLTLDSFALRQSNSSSDETMTFDNLVITSSVVPEPGTYALLAGFSALGFVMLRRRK